MCVGGGRSVQSVVCGFSSPKHITIMNKILLFFKEDAHYARRLYVVVWIHHHL
jgi:hypothetical protein